MSTFKPDAGIPLLTEIIEAPNALDASVTPTPPTLDHAVAAPPILHTPQATHDAEQWRQLERDLHERVLQQVLKRIDFALEQRVRDSLADVLQTAVENLAAEIRAGLEQTIRDVVTRAVTQEINAARISK